MNSENKSMRNTEEEFGKEAAMLKQNVFLQLRFN